MRILTRKSIVLLISVAFTYTAVAIYAVNYSLVFQTLFEPAPITYKLSILSGLLLGITTAFSSLDAILLLITAFLVGINLTLLTKTLNLIQKNGGFRVAFGGSLMLGFVSTGCASCGLSLLSVVGLTASLSVLPFHGEELKVITILLLSVSLYFLIRGIEQAKLCKV